MTTTTYTDLKQDEVDTSLPFLYLNLNLEIPQSIQSITTLVDRETLFATTMQTYTLKMLLTNLARKASRRYGVGYQTNHPEPLHKNPSRIGKDLLQKVIKRLEETGYVRVVKGKWSCLNDGVGQSAVMYPTKKLLSLIDAQAEQESLSTHIQTEVGVIVRNTDKSEKVLNLSNPTVKSLVSSMRDLNNFLSNTEVTVGDKEVSNQYIRIFNQSMQKGGRLYTLGNGVQQVKSADRASLMIDGNTTVEVDISACHLVIANLIDGQTTEQESPYEHILAHQGFDVTPSNMAVIKAAVMRILNNPTLQSVVTSIQRVLKVDVVDSDFKSPIQVLNAITDTYPAIEKQLGNGMKLMNYDSQIALKVMQQLKEQGITVCAVHDSFVVKGCYVNHLCIAILDAFVEVFKVDRAVCVPVKVIQADGSVTRQLLSAEALLP